MNPEQQLSNFILLLELNDVTIYDTFMWNWVKLSLCDNVLFIVSCINDVITDKICWTTLIDKGAWIGNLYELPMCIRFIDETGWDLKVVEAPKTFFIV
jgi:hypothetical protein